MLHDRLITHHRWATGLQRLALSALMIFAPLQAAVNLPSAAAELSEIELTPAEGEVGTNVAIAGLGFAPLAEIQVEFGGDNVTVAAADELGEFAADFEVPESTPAGTISVVATEISENATFASADFTVINTPPAADSQAPVRVEEGSSELVIMTGSDPNGDALSFELVDLPAHGSISAFDPDAGEALYTPEVGYSGEDSFSFKVSDGEADSDTSVITLAVVSAGAAEVPDIEAGTQEDQQVAILLDLSSVDSPSVEFVLISDPQHGILGDLDSTGPYTAEVTYLPDPDYNGDDSFAYGGYDEEANLTVGIVNVAIEPVNDPPYAEDKSVGVKENSRKRITLEASDPDGDPLTYTITSQPSHGELNGTAPHFYYYPDEGYNGEDDFKFVASDSVFRSNVAEVLIFVDARGSNGYDDEPQGQQSNGQDEGTPVGAAPVAQSMSVSGNEDTAIEIALAAKDADGDVLTFSIMLYPEHGMITEFDESTGELTYTPEEEFSGTDSLTFVAADDHKKSKKATVSILIEAVNDPPRPSSMNVTAPDGTANITLAAFDPEGDPLQFAIYSQPSNGTLSGNGTDLFYVANEGYSGSDRFLFTVTDGRPDSRIGVVWIIVGEPANDVSEEPAVDDTPTDADEPEEEPGPPEQGDRPGRNDAPPEQEKSTEKARADKSKVLVLLDWVHQDGQKDIKSTLHLSFAEHRTREPLGSHIWYDLIVLDGMNNEILRKNDLVAENAEDVQDLTFPTNGTYHVEVNVKGLIDKSTNAITRSTDYTGKAIGIVVVPEFSAALALIVIVVLMSSGIALARHRGALGQKPF